MACDIWKFSEFYGLDGMDGFKRIRTNYKELKKGIRFDWYNDVSRKNYNL